MIRAPADWRSSEGAHATSLEAELGALEAEVRRLRLALGTTVAVARAVGVLAERLRLVYDDAEALLERAARRAGRDTVALAAEIAPGIPPPPANLDELRELRRA